MAVDAAVIKATQESLGPFVKKPPLTEKLLGKPPFIPTGHQCPDPQPDPETLNTNPERQIKLILSV